MFEKIEKILKDKYFNGIIPEVSFCQLQPSENRVVVEMDGHTFYFGPGSSSYPALVMCLGFDTLDEAVIHSRLMEESQVVFETGGKFYNCTRETLGEEFEILVKVDGLTKDTIHVFNGVL